MLTTNSFGLNFVLILASSVGIHLVSLDVPSFDDQHGISDEDLSDGSYSPGQAEDYIESWLYMHIPDFGTFTLREVLEEGTLGHDAFGTFGYPIEDFEPIELMTTNPTQNNNGIVVYMLAEHCLGDFNDDGTVNIGDLSLFTIAYSEGDLIADLTGNGEVDIFDQIFFIQLLSMGCVTM